MKLKSLALAAFGLLAVASATAIPPSDDSLSTQHDYMSAAVDAGLVDPATRAITSDNCKQHCIVPKRQCMDRCGNTSDCEHKCACELFGGRNLCVTFGCVPKPTNCHKVTKRDEYESLVESIPPPAFPCVACRAAIQRCIKECGSAPHCDQDCRCYHNGHNPNCNTCDDAYCWGHVNECQTLPPRQEHKGELTTDESPASISENIDPATGIGGWPPGTMWEICDQCDKAVKKCKAGCGSDPACNISCPCQAKQTAGSCKGCGKFKPRCRWPRNTPEDEPESSQVSSETQSSDPGPKDCQLCVYAIKDCKQQNCPSNNSACELSCQCKFKKEFIPCQNCSAVECKENSSEVSPEIQFLGPGPTECQVCAYAIKDCKQRYCHRSDSGCHLWCDCIHKEQFGACQNCPSGVKCPV